MNDEIEVIRAVDDLLAREQTKTFSGQALNQTQRIALMSIRSHALNAWIKKQWPAYCSKGSGRQSRKNILIREDI